MWESWWFPGKLGCGGWYFFDRLAESTIIVGGGPSCLATHHGKDMNRSLIAISSTIALSAAPCFATPVEATFIGIDGDAGCDVRVAFRDTSGQLVPMVPTRVFSTEFAGPRAFEIGGEQLRSYSLDVTGETGSGMFENVSLESLLGGPSLLSAWKADALAALSNAYNGGLFQDRVRAAAFQAMIWEIVIDFDGTEESLVLDGTGSRDFMVKGISVLVFEEMKQQVLARIDTTHRFNVYSSPGLESMIVFGDSFSVPLPGASALGLVGLSLVGARRRRTA